jgi:hypothetical protein
MTVLGRIQNTKTQQTITRKMPCGGKYAQSEVCLGMYHFVLRADPVLSKFCEKCVIFSGKDLEAPKVE